MNICRFCSEQPSPVTPVFVFTYSNKGICVEFGSRFAWLFCEILWLVVWNAMPHANGVRDWEVRFARRSLEVLRWPTFWRLWLHWQHWHYLSRAGQNFSNLTCKHNFSDISYWRWVRFFVSSILQIHYIIALKYYHLVHPSIHFQPTTLQDRDISQHILLQR